MGTTQINPCNIKMMNGAVVINNMNMNSGIIMREMKLLANPNLWNKIIVQGCDNLDRNIILKAILDDVHPLDLIPVFFFVEGTSASFLARNCRHAIEKLCRQNLIVANPQNSAKPFKLMIILAFSNTSELVINVQDNICSVLQKRFQQSSKTLDLDTFYKDPGLIEFSSLSQPKILYFVLHLSKQYTAQSLILSNNDIRILSPVESIWGMKSLTILDLRNNLIENINELSILKTMQIKELFLDGNPVCDLLDEHSYIKAVREVCPHIQKLDGVILGPKGFLPFRRNYLCNNEGQELINQFLAHYFTLYDGITRMSLDGLYSKDAMFSLTCAYLHGHGSVTAFTLGQFKSRSRNLKMMSDLSKNSECLVLGGVHIVQSLAKLNVTDHDPYSFTVDLMLYTEQTIVFTVTGSFREPPRSKGASERMFGFSRTFVLRAGENNEYNITNDLLHVSNATSAQHQRAFQIACGPQTSQFKVKPAKTPTEKHEMQETFKAITTLNFQWSKKCLEECAYDLSKALIMFVDLHKVDRIPEDAFV